MGLAGTGKMFFLAGRLLFVGDVIFVGDGLGEVFLLKIDCFSYEDLKVIYGLIMSLK